MAREFTIEDVIEFKIEDWTNAAYPINVRLTNIHRRCAEHEKAGIPLPMSAVVCLTELVQRTNTTLHFHAITSILRTLDDLRIENEVQRIQLAIKDIPTQATSSDQVTYENDLEVWKQKVWYLGNLYAASIYLEQIAVLKASGKDFNNMDALTSLASRTATWDYVGWYERIHAHQAIVDSHNQPRSDENEEEQAEGFDEEQRAMIDQFAAHVNRTAEDEEEYMQASARDAEIEAQEYVRRQAEGEAMQEDSGVDALQGSQDDEQLSVQDDIDPRMEQEDLQDEAEEGEEGIASQSDEQPDATAARAATKQTALADTSTGTVPSGAQTVSPGDTQAAAVGSQSTPTREHDRNGRAHYRAPGGQFVAGSGNKAKANTGKKKAPAKMPPSKNSGSTASEQSGRKRKHSGENTSTETQDGGEKVEPKTSKRMRTRSAGKQDNNQGAASQDVEATGVDGNEIPSEVPLSVPAQQAEVPFQSSALGGLQLSGTASTSGVVLPSAAAAEHALTAPEDAVSSVASPSRPKLTIKINPSASARKRDE